MHSFVESKYDFKHIIEASSQTMAFNLKRCKMISNIAVPFIHLDISNVKKQIKRY